MPDYSLECPRCRKAEASLRHTQDWYASRIRRLEEWFRHEGKDLPIAKEFWNILANGVADLDDPPTYAQVLALKEHKIAELERKLAKS